MSTPTDPAALGAASKRTAAMLRDARSVLRRIDTLAATASAVDDPASRSSLRFAAGPSGSCRA